MALLPKKLKSIIVFKLNVVTNDVVESKKHFIMF